MKKQLPVTKEKEAHACNDYWKQARKNIKAAVTNIVFVKYWLERFACKYSDTGKIPARVSTFPLSHGYM